MSKVIKFVAAGDNHGDMVDEEAAQALFAFIKQFKPDERIHLGDCFDLRSIRKDASRKEQNESLEEDLDMGCEFLKRFEPTVYLFGNHEDRLDAIISSPPSAYAEDYFSERRDRIRRTARSAGAKKIYPYHADLGVHRINSMVFIHGYEHGLNATEKQGSHYCRDGVRGLVHGHTHNLSSIALTAHKSGNAFSAGCLCQKQAMTYAKNRLATSRWGSGFVAGIIDGTEYKAWLVHKIGGRWVWFQNLHFFNPRHK